MFVIPNPGGKGFAASGVTDTVPTNLSNWVSSETSVDSYIMIARPQNRVKFSSINVYPSGEA